MFYLLSMATSLFTSILVITMLFSDPESYIFRMFGDTEIYFCVGVAIILLVAGLITERGRSDV